MLGEAFASVLGAAQEGAGWAFERLYRDLAPAVAGFARMRGASDAEGLVNEVFLGVFRGLTQFSGDEDAFRSWVFTITHRRLVDEQRRAAVRPQLAGAEVPDILGGNAEEDVFANLGVEWVRETLDHLSPDQRDVLLLRVVADLTVEQVAEVVGKKPGAVKQLQRRGLDAIRRKIFDEAVPI